jgi:putative drug exporter of the RND superfamily
MYEPITVEVNEAGTVVNITVPMKGKGTDAESYESLAVLRDEILPTTVGAFPDAETGVTGLTASWIDSTNEMKANLLPAVAFVLVFAFLLMLVAFRSPVIAAKAIVLNLLSVARPTECSCSSSSTASERICSGSARRPGSIPPSRCSCS